MLRSLYRTIEIVVWVEDELTREYLSALWRDYRIGFAVAAGREGVSALTTDARSAPDQRTNVFGIRDRDFGETNSRDWTSPNTCLFTLPRHEIENYLLDWDALKAYGDERLGTDARKRVKRDAREIERRVKKRAAKLTWWAACKKILSELHVELTSEFPRDPTQEEITCLVGALNYILKTNDWHGRLCNLLSGSFDANSISKRLTCCHDENKLALGNDSWLTVFPGKPLYREARSYVQGAREEDSARREPDIDLARAVANWQVDKNHRPPDLMTLRECVLKRVGLA